MRRPGPQGYAAAGESSAVEVVLALAGLVSALVAVGALWSACETVRETRALRREDRLARLPELVAEAGNLTGGTKIVY
jgi:hypothetical protein